MSLAPKSNEEPAVGECGRSGSRRAGRARGAPRGRCRRRRRPRRPRGRGRGSRCRGRATSRAARRRGARRAAAACRSAGSDRAGRARTRAPAGSAIWFATASSSSPVRSLAVRPGDVLDALDHARSPFGPGVNRRCGLVLSSARPRRGVQRRRGGVDDGPVGAVDELPDADRADHRLEHARPVGGGVVEDQRVGRGGAVAAAGGEALELQRRAAGQHREQHPQARDARGGRRAGRRTRRPASARRSRSGPATRGAAGRRGPPRPEAATGPGWTNSGASCSFEPGEQRADALERVGGGEGGRRQRDADAAPGRSRRRLQRGRAPRSCTAPQPPKRAGRSSMPWWWASSRGAASSAGSVSIPSAVESATSARSISSRRSSTVRSATSVASNERTLSGSPATRNVHPLAPANQRRRPPPPGQLGDQRLGEKVLMNVDALHCCLSLSRFST